MSLFNFLADKPRPLSPWFCLLMLVLWFSSIHHFIQYQRAKKQPLIAESKIKLNQNLQIYKILQDISRLSFHHCFIKKIELYPHELLIYGKGFQERSIALITRQLQLINESKQVEVKQWDYIKTGKWRFIIGVAY